MAVVAMKPSCASLAGRSRRLVSPANRNVSVFAAVAAGLVAGAVVAAAAGAVVGAAAGAVVGAAAGAVVGFGAAAGAVGAGAGAAGPQAARRPIPAVRPARPRNRRRLSGDASISDRLPLKQVLIGQNNSGLDGCHISFSFSCRAHLLPREGRPIETTLDELGNFELADLRPGSTRSRSTCPTQSSSSSKSYAWINPPGRGVSDAEVGPLSMQRAL